MRFHKTILQEFYQIAFRRKIIGQSRSCKLIWMSGCIPTIMTANASGKDVLWANTHANIIDGKEVWNDKITALNS
jgi:hypothetical protein